MAHQNGVIGVNILLRRNQYPGGSSGENGERNKRRRKARMHRWLAVSTALKEGRHLKASSWRRNWRISENQRHNGWLA